MSYSLKSGSSDTDVFIFNLQHKILEIIKDDVVGIYIHGSLAMGGFNPKSSDIDLLVITKNSLTLETKRTLAKIFLRQSNSPFPIEISFLNSGQLRAWQHPCPFDFHYSEFWRERYTNDLLNNTDKFLNIDVNTDTDLAAHITIINNRGICVYGKPIDEIFPPVPSSDYLSSIMDDFTDCLNNIEESPIYCTLNLVRVYWYLKEGVISSKQEAGDWGMCTLPKEVNKTIRKAIECYSNDKSIHNFESKELDLLKTYISNDVNTICNYKRTRKTELPHEG